MGNFAHDGQTPVPQAENNANHSIGVGKSAKDNDEDEEDEDEDGSLTPVINDLNSSLVKESYESIIPEDVTRSEIEAPLMSGSCNWELIEKPENQSNPSSPFEIVPISSEQITELMEETPEKMLGEKVSAVPGLPTESTETSTSATISTVSTTTTITTTIKSGTSQGSGFDDNDQPSISDGSATWLSSSLGTIVGMGNSSLESSTGGQLSDRFGGNGGSGQVSGLTDSINSFDLIGQSSDNNLGTGDALSSLESQGHSLTTNLTSNQIVTSITTITTMTTTTIVTSSSPEMLALVSGSDAVEISDFERYDVDRSSLDDFSPGLRLPEHGNDNLGGSLSSVNDINEIPSEAAANDTPLISQSSVASSILSEQTRHQLSYDLSPEIPCQGSGGETLTQRSDDTQLFSDGDGTRPQSPIPPADFGSNVVVGTSMGMYDTWEEKSPCSDDTDMCMVMTPSVSDVNMPPPLTPFLPPLTGHSSGNGLTGNPIEGLIELGRIEEEEDEFGLITGSSKNVSNVNNNTTSSDDYRPMTLGFDRSKPIPVSSIITGHITTVAEGSHEGSSTGSSLQEFEKLEAEVTSSKVAHGVRPSHHGSSDSIGSFGSIGGKPLHGKGSQGDDSLSVNSLMEFEKLESECRDAEVIESAARDEAARLSEIEEGHESQASDSQETLSDQGNSDEENADIEKRIKELDEMIEVTKPINPNETKKNP
ncbi:uncharacterized protein LOC128391398 [Panonychus citri]|uniref:uncharacterized protein LOC128391398 n=1 Tax=Panonychus citri TaxID=50023 RepID=UPI002307610D|nr:uncharacterized protein LOC128391398 [Panonychus citri]